MSKHLAIAAIVLAGLAGTSCGTTASSPTSPSATSATVTSLTLTAAAPAGAGFQIKASAGLSDGTSKDVTALSSWESMSPQLATISNGGMVTVVSAGEADFRATYLAVAAGLHVSVIQSRYTLSGRVTPVYPNFPLYISGATVLITSGPNVGTFAITDSLGYYSINGLSPSTVGIQVKVAGFSTWTLNNLPIGVDASIDPVLFPTPPVNASGLSATAQCLDASWTWTQTLDRACAAHLGVAWGVCPGPICDSIGNIR